MKLHYYPETDSLYIELMEKPGVETYEIREGLNADVDADGNVVGFDIDHLAALLAADARSSAAQGVRHLAGETTGVSGSGSQVIYDYARAFDAATIGSGIHPYLDAFSGILKSDVLGQRPRAISLTFDDPAPSFGAMAESGKAMRDLDLPA